jgi:hypothetical protein
MQQAKMVQVGSTMEMARREGEDARVGRKSTSLPIIDLLKKKQLRLHGGPDGLAKYQTKKKKNKQNVDAYVDYRQVIPQSLLRLKEAALRAQANPEGWTSSLT